MSEVTEENVRRLMELWPEKISYSKAQKRLQKAIDAGCPMLGDCANCPKLHECPVVTPEES